MFIIVQESVTGNLVLTSGLHPQPCVLVVSGGIDTISIGDLTTTNISFTLITNETATFSEYPWFSGIVGEICIPPSKSFVLL